MKLSGYTARMLIVILGIVAVFVLAILIALLLVQVDIAYGQVSGPGGYGDWLVLTPACWSYVEVYAEAGHGVAEVIWTPDNTNWYAAVPGGWWVDHAVAIELYSPTAYFDVELLGLYCENFLPTLGD
jgi:hypothetical protein